MNKHIKLLFTIATLFIVISIMTFTVKVLAEDKGNYKALDIEVNGTDGKNMAMVTIVYENNVSNINNLKLLIDKYSGIPNSGRFSAGIYGSNELVTDYNDSSITAISAVPTLAEDCALIKDGETENYYLNVNTSNLNYKYLYVGIRVYGGSSFNSEYKFNVSGIRLVANGQDEENILSASERYGLTVTHNQEEKENIDDTEKTVYLIGHFGQSNAEGRGSNTRPDSMNKNAIYVDIDKERILFGNQFTDKVSSSAEFANDLANLSGEKIAIVKSAVSGSSLGGSDNKTWNTEAVNSLANQAVIDYQKAVKVLEDLGYNVVKLGFVWTQGESDFSSHYEATYEENFTKLITKFKKEIDPNFKTFINLVGDRNKDDSANVVWASLEKIRNAQINVARKLDNVYIISDIAPRFVDSDLNLMKDLWHYTDEAYILLGKEGAEKVYEYIFKESKESFDLAAYKEEKVNYLNKLKEKATDEDIKKEIEDIINKINEDTTATKADVDKLVHDAEFLMGADIVKENYQEIIDSYKNKSTKMDEIISKYNDELENNKTVYELSTLAEDAINSLKLQEAKEKAIEKLDEYMNDNATSEMKEYYEKAKEKINSSDDIDEVNTLVDESVAKLQEMIKNNKGENSKEENSKEKNTNDSNKIKSPNTYDNIMTYIALLITAILSFIGIFKKIKKLS